MTWDDPQGLGKLNRRRQIRLALNAHDFHTLVTGGIIEKSSSNGTPIAVALQDVNHEAFDAILNAKDIYRKNFAKKRDA